MEQVGRPDWRRRSWGIVSCQEKLHCSEALDDSHGFAATGIVPEFAARQRRERKLFVTIGGEQPACQRQQLLEQRNAMPHGTAFLCKGPDGQQRLHQIDAECSTPGNLVLRRL